jgi:hypothetical protein
VPADFLPIEDTLPGVHKRAVHARAVSRSPSCSPTTTIFRYGVASTTLTATTRTTLRIIYDANNPFNVHLDPPGDNPIWTQTYVPPRTVT